MLLNQCQDYLASLYEAPTEYDVYDFLITDARQADALSPPGHCANNERILVAESDSAMEISVYLDGDTLALLHEDDPFVGLHDGNLAAFMLAVEGVSHFHYLCWNATFDKSVTLLELELQAEVDKYVVAAGLLEVQGTATNYAALQQRLFEDVRFHHDLDDENRTRYRDANHYAARYCRSLSELFPDGRRAPHLKSELRRFYRLTQNEKIRRIERAG